MGAQNAKTAAPIGTAAAAGGDRSHPERATIRKALGGPDGAGLSGVPMSVDRGGTVGALTIGSGEAPTAEGVYEGGHMDQPLSGLPLAGWWVFPTERESISFGYAALGKRKDCTKMQVQKDEAPRAL